MTRLLDSCMSNDDAYLLGRIADVAGHDGRADVGDSIDRGLILRRLLEEQGFGLTKLDTRAKRSDDLKVPLSDTYWGRTALYVMANEEGQRMLALKGWKHDADEAWRPINTAPQDGSVVDLWRDGERLTDYWWSQTRKTWITHSGFPVVTVCLTTRPTHWMFAPTPPPSVNTLPTIPPPRREP